jgi:hypothetical protein
MSVFAAPVSTIFKGLCTSPRGGQNADDCSRLWHLDRLQLLAYSHTLPPPPAALLGHVSPKCEDKVSTLALSAASSKANLGHLKKVSVIISTGRIPQSRHLSHLTTSSNTSLNTTATADNPQQEACPILLWRRRSICGLPNGARLCLASGSIDFCLQF